MKNRIQRQGFLNHSARATQEKKMRLQSRTDSVQQLYKTEAWRTLKRLVLLEQPMCACGCGGRSTVVDHIRPHRGDSALFFDRGNLQGMTKICHDRKTAKYDGGFGNEVTEAPKAEERKPDTDYWIV